MAASKFIKLVNGTKTEEAPVTTSTADKIPALDGSGLLNTNMLDTTATGGSAGDVNKLGLLDAAGKWPTAMIPGGTDANTAVLTVKEALASAGAFVYFDETAGGVKKAVNTDGAKQALGYALTAAGFDSTTTIYFEGKNTALTGLVAGKRYYLGTAGVATATPPTATGSVVQFLGVAISTTTLVFEPDEGIVLA